MGVIIISYNMYIIYIKMGNQQDPTVQHREHRLMFCGSLDEGSLEENGHRYVYA